MKKIYPAVLAALTMGMTSCSDFLDLIPLNDIVAENYWTEKADLQSVLYGCYSQFESEDCMQRMFIWGELRSDNVVANTSANVNIQHISQENIELTNPYLQWQSFYQIINRCNTVIKYAPIVAEEDPNYSISEVRANIAEATFLRSLAYFYLLRTFSDVPYTTRPSDNDGDIDGDFRIPAMPRAELIQHLVNDLETVRPDALRLYPIESATGEAANTSRVTSCAINALLADLYLWQDNYQQCIACCDRVLSYKMERYEELKDERPDDAADIELWFEKYPLLMEQPSGNSQGAAYTTIFGDGNSFESIFEFYFNQNRSSQNTLVANFFGSSSRPEGDCSVDSRVFAGIYDKTNLLFKPTDCRVPESIEERAGSKYCIRKYAYQTSSFSIDNKASNISMPQRPGTLRSQAYSNWIVYRLTDVLLMKAEAEVETGDPAALDDAFEIVSAIYNRANNFNAASTGVLVREEYPTVSDLRELVMSERRRELMFEGKRWFDLVRYAIRNRERGGLDYVINQVKQKQKERVNVIVNQLKKDGALFWPYLESEIDANPNLIQNSAFNKNEHSQL